MTKSLLVLTLLFAACQPDLGPPPGGTGGATSDDGGAMSDAGGAMNDDGGTGDGGAGAGAGGKLEGGAGGAAGSPGELGDRIGTVIGPDGGIARGPHGAEVEVPPGALATSVEITIAVDGDQAQDVLPSGIATIGAVYEITPHELSFALPVTVRIPFDATSLPEDTAPTLYQAEPGEDFFELTTRVESSEMLAADVSGFSSFVAGAYTSTELIVTLSGEVFAYDTIRDTLSPLSTLPIGLHPASVALSPAGDFFYVATNGDNIVRSPEIYEFSLSNAGGSSLTSGRVVVGDPEAGNALDMLAVSPSGSRLYAGKQSLNADSVWVYEIYDDGGLAKHRALPRQTLDPNVPSFIKVDPSGKNAFVYTGLYPGLTSDNITQYRIDAAGELRLGTPALVPGSRAEDLSFGPNGDVFTIEGDQGRYLLRYHRTPEGLLITPPDTLATADTLQTMQRFKRVVVPSDGQSVYVLGTTVDGASAIYQFMFDTQGTLVPLNPDAVVGSFDYRFALDYHGRHVLVGTADGTGDGLTSMARGRNGLLGPPHLLGSTSRVGVITTARNQLSATLTTASGNPCVFCGRFTRPPARVPPNSDLPPVTFELSVSHGVWGGWILSNPDGIDYGHDWILGSPDRSSSSFPEGAVVLLCEYPPPSPAQAYDVEWTGDCNSTQTCVSVRLDRSKSCHLELIPRH